MNEKKTHIITSFKSIGIDLTDAQADQFYDYYELLIDWNNKINLTAITDFDEVVLKHFVDSASGSYVYKCSAKDKVLDLGTGAGFPGIPLKILYPGTEFVLMDSLNKRIKFLDEVITALSLKKVEAVHGRAEEMARNKQFRENFSLCTSRAVANTSTLLEYCIPFVRVGGCFLAYKSGKFKEEVLQASKTMELLTVQICEQKDFLLPGSDMDRTLVLFEKLKKTGGKFPRKAGLPSKEPLG